MLCYYEIMPEENLLQGSLPQITPNIAPALTPGLQAPRQAQSNLPQFKFASPLIRLICYLLDGFLVGLFTAQLIPIFLKIMDIRNFDIIQNLLISAIFVSLLYCIYFSIFNGLLGASPAKMLFKVRVINKSGQKIGLPLGFVREILSKGVLVFSAYLNILFIGISFGGKLSSSQEFLAGVGIISSLIILLTFAWSLIDSKKQTLQDKIVGAYVIKVDRN